MQRDEANYRELNKLPGDVKTYGSIVRIEVKKERLPEDSERYQDSVAYLEDFFAGMFRKICFPGV